MSQTRRRSVYEAWINIIVGIAIQFFVSYAVLKAQGLAVTWSGMGQYALVMTAVSFVRQYCLRRVFNLWD